MSLITIISDQKNRFEAKQSGFFSKNTQDDFVKSYLINADTHMPTSEGRTTMTGVYLKFGIEKRDIDLYYNIDIFSWSNEEQEYVPLRNSIWNEKDFCADDFIAQIEDYYSKIIHRFMIYLDKEINTSSKLKELIYRIENPTYIFHYKLLNLFSQTCLEQFQKYNLSNNAVLYIDRIIRTMEDKNKRISHPFLPQYIAGYYIDGIEISTDLDDSDEPLIEDMINGGTLSVQDFKVRFMKEVDC